MSDVEEQCDDPIVIDGRLKTGPDINECVEEVKIVDNVNEVLEQTVEETRKIDVEMVIKEVERMKIGTKKRVINSKPLDSVGTTYELETFNKNIVLVFNHTKIVGEPDRMYSKKDYDVLFETLIQYRFYVIPHDNYKEKQIFDTFEHFFDEGNDFSDYGCVFIVILTHGGSGGNLWASDKMYNEERIVSYLSHCKNLSLLTKPKVLIVQACRGPTESRGIQVGALSEKIRKDFAPTSKTYTSPGESDILIVHSSYVGNTSYSHIDEGSWLIQTLCQKIKECSDQHDLLTILTRVKQIIAINKAHKVKNRRTNMVDINKQMPVVTTTLIRDLYLIKSTTARVFKRWSVNELYESQPDHAFGEGGTNSCDCTERNLKFHNRMLDRMTESGVDTKPWCQWRDALPPSPNTEEVRGIIKKFCLAIREKLMEDASHCAVCKIKLDPYIKYY